MSNIFKLDVNSNNPHLESKTKAEILQNLEDGKVIFMPNLSFKLSKKEEELLKPNSFNLNAKSIKYNVKTNQIWGVDNLEQKEVLQNLIGRYAKFSEDLIKNILPFYQNSIEIGNSSLRPVEAKGRVQTKKHDDTRLHVDAFPSRPVHGKRLLRVFANINTEGEPRIWNAGEPFTDVADRFLPQISKPIPFVNHILKALKITKSLRTDYDYYMLNLHDKMKLDDNYQQTVNKERVEFNAGCVWVCFSDQTSHAVLSGRGLLEQTIYLESDRMYEPKKSPLAILENKLKRKLI